MTIHARRLAPLACMAGILAVCLLTGAQAARAADGRIELGIKPVGVDGAYFMVTVQPGETRQLAVELGNYGAAPVEARTYAADAYSIVNGGFGAKLDGEPTSGATRWLDYQPVTLTLEPGTGVTRAFALTVPDDAAPGDYISGLVIQNANPTPGVGGIALNQINRQAIAVAIDVPGPRTPALSIGAFTHRMVAGKSLVAAAVMNTGNQLLKPGGEFTLRDAAGTLIERRPVALDSVYAGMDTSVEIPFDRLLGAGNYVASLTLTDAATGATATASDVALAIPQLEAPPVVAGVSPSSGADAPSASPAQATSSGVAAWQLLAVIAGTAGVAVVATLAIAGRGRRSRPRPQSAAPTPPLPARPATVRPLLPSRQTRR